MVCVGKVTHAHGIKGELFIHLFERENSWIHKVSLLQLSSSLDSSDILEFKVQHLRPHKKGFIAKVEGIEDRTEAEKYNKYFMQVSRELLMDQDSGEYSAQACLGMQVYAQSDENLGRVTGIEFNGAHYILHIKSDSETILLPFVPSFILEIQVEENKLIVEVPEGLRELS